MQQMLSACTRLAHVESSSASTSWNWYVAGNPSLHTYCGRPYVTHAALYTHKHPRIVPGLETVQTARSPLTPQGNPTCVLLEFPFSTTGRPGDILCRSACKK